MSFEVHARHARLQPQRTPPHQPVSIALNALIDASVIGEQTRGYLGAVVDRVTNACDAFSTTGCAITEHPPRTARSFSIADIIFEQRSREHFARANFKFATDDRLRFTGARRHCCPAMPTASSSTARRSADVAYPCLWEHKALNAKGWCTLDRDGFEKAYPQYAAQVALYQHFLGVDENPAIFTAMNADSCERLHLLVPYDAGKAQQWIERAETSSRRPRAGELLPRFTDDQNNWRCRLVRSSR